MNLNDKMVEMKEVTVEVEGKKVKNSTTLTGAKYEYVYKFEEKTEKLANIEYDRMIKKEFGKPKSVTKRTVKEYQEEDIDAKIEELTQLLQDTHQMEEPQVVNQYIKK